MSLVLLAAGLAAATGCRQAPGAGSSSGAGGRLVATFSREPLSFNRLVSANPAETIVALLTQDTLVRVHRVTGELEPRLAREWSASADGLTYTLKLRENVTFSDGVPLTAADVVFTFQGIYDRHVASPMASAFLINGKPVAVSAVDDRTVRIAFPSVFGPGLTILSSLPILPRHKLGDALAAGTLPGAWNLKTPPAEIVGAGPFMLVEYTSGQRLRFVRNPKFWQRPLPHLDEIELSIVPERNGELLRLESGQSDLTSDFVRAEDMATLRQAEAKGTIRLIDVGVDTAPEGLWFNLVPGAVAAKDRPWLQREELRKAISYAVDRQAIVDTVYLGAAVPVYGPITQGHGEWYDADLPRPPRDLAKARALLASIGLADRNGDGKLEDRQGAPARFSILTTRGNTIRERIAAMLQDQLRQVGLTVDIVAQDTKQVIAQLGKGDYDAIYYGVHADAVDPARNLDFWMSSGSFHFWNPNQTTPATTWEARVDELMLKQSTTVDRVERRRLFTEAQAVLMEHLPCIYFAAAKATVATSSRVSGATPSVLQPPILWNAEVLSVGPAARR